MEGVFMASLPVHRLAEIAESCGMRQIIVSAALFAVFSPVMVKAGTANEKVDEAARLVGAAAQAEMQGDFTAAIAKLHAAIQADPQNKIAHWQLGEIQSDGKW